MIAQAAGSEITTTTYKGAWGLVDNGYHRWSCTQAPGKHDLLLTELRVSQWIESFRKDVECTFGILKGRFRILKTGICLATPEAADNIWHTCCALHNMLLEVDGLHVKWTDGVPSDWEGPLGENDPDEMRRMAPLAIRRLANPQEFGSQQHEIQSREPVPLVPPTQDDDSVDSSVCVPCTQDGLVPVNSLTYTDFRQRLVTHFDIQWRQNKVVWPRSHKEE
jgi:DDE superfamily endonuclease